MDMDSDNSSDDMPSLIEDDSDDSSSDHDYIPNQEEIQDMINNDNDNESDHQSENDSDSDIISNYSDNITQLFQMQIYKDNTSLWKKYCSIQKQKMEMEKTFSIFEEKIISKYHDMKSQRNTMIVCLVAQQLFFFFGYKFH